MVTVNKCVTTTSVLVLVPVIRDMRWEVMALAVMVNYIKINIHTSYSTVRTNCLTLTLTIMNNFRH